MNDAIRLAKSVKPVARVRLSEGGELELRRAKMAKERAGGQELPSSKFMPNVPRQVRADGGDVTPDIQNPMSVFPKPQRMFPEDDRPAGGQYLSMPDKQDMTGHKSAAASIGIGSGGKPYFTASRDAVDETGTSGKGNAVAKTNLFKQKAGWRWQDAPEGHEDTNTIVSVEHRGKHYYALNAHFPKGVDLARYENSPSEPRLRPTTRGNVDLGPQAGSILVRGKEHPVYHHVIVKADGGGVLGLAKSVKPVERVKLADGGSKKTVGSVDHPVWIPTRLGSKTDPTDANSPKISDMESLKASPNNVFGKNMNLVRNYINVPQNIALRANDDELAEYFINHMKENLLALHDQIRPDIRERSSKWYDGARAITDRMSAKYNLPDHSVAGVYAALSPQKDWFQNVSLGNRVLDIMHNHHDTPMDDAMMNRFNQMIKPTASQIKNGADPALEKYLSVAQMMHGKSLTDIDNMGLKNNERLAAKALWLRLHDETYGDKKYAVVAPEGDDSNYAMTDSGVPKKVAWGSFNEIGKAIAAIENKNDPEAMSKLMGTKHKVRNFYNNILVPNSTLGDVTADTHAVAAALYRPLSGKSLEVGHNLDTSTGKGLPNAAGSDITGIRGTYPLVAEAYRRAAKEREILPRQMQSITWEGIRGLFSPSFKSNKTNVSKIDNIWKDFRAGNISQEQARALTHEAASTPQGKIPHPDWHTESGPSGGALGPDETSGAQDQQGNLSPLGAFGNAERGSLPRGGRGSPEALSAPPQVEFKKNGGEVEPTLHEKLAKHQENYIPHDDPRRGESLAEFHKDAHPDLKNPDGSPKVFYHGTRALYQQSLRDYDSTPDFQEFDTKSSEMGSHFGPQEQASDFTGSEPEQRGHMYPVHLNIKNPIRLQDNGSFSPRRAMYQLPKEIIEKSFKYLENSEPQEALQNALKEHGHDGIVYLNRREGLNDYGKRPNPEDLSYLGDDAFKKIYPEAQDSYIAFDPEQIKSALGNQGTFDPSKPRMNEARGGFIHPVRAISGFHIDTGKVGQPMFTGRL